MALAARLTEDVNISVLVLEAGEEKLDDPLIGECELVYSVSIGLTPLSLCGVVNIGQYGRTFGQEEYDWCSKTVA